MSRSYQRQVYVRARDLMRRHGFRSVVDIGCGPATKLIEILKPVASELVGLDTEAAVEYCRRLHGDEVFHAVDLERPALDLNRTFDLVICSDVIEHLEDPDLLLDLLLRLVAPSGLIVLSTPERDGLRGPDSNVPPAALEHVREWNRSEFATYLEERGFAILDHRLLLPLALVRGAWIRALRIFARQALKGRDLRTCQMVVCRPR
jgi:SAM-dependent methyltransferase